MVCLVTIYYRWIHTSKYNLPLAHLGTYKKAKRKAWHICSEHLAWPAAVVWAIGFVTYCVGTHVPLGNNFFSVAPMAAIHATEMFLSVSDISAIHEDCHNSALFMFWFNFSHFMAVLISLVFIFRQFGFFVIEKFRLFVHAWMVKLHLAKRKKLYVFGESTILTMLWPNQ